jgi:F-type H+-transporting ATPase subunit gamma
MKTVESLRRSIAVATELHSIVKTMKALAGVNIRQYERSAHAVIEYNRTVEMGLQIALASLGPQSVPLNYAPGKQLGAIVFGSDRGMCGLLNDQVVSHAARALRTLTARVESHSTLAVGVRANDQLEAFGYPVEGCVRVPTSVLAITGAVNEVMRTLEDWHFKRNVNLVILFYAAPTSGASYRVASVRLLPIDVEWINSLRARPWPSKIIPMFTMNKTQLFQGLIREYLFVSLFRAFAESLASENASRLASMQVAERNIDDRLRALNLESRRLRQDAMTAELLDIIESSEALRTGGGI